ncbi:hypothetical protein NF27_EU00020 [Candidatus Jidaibacter acanthamoeba]|uniref:Uncharacterized protein n=1 Tax=Candidatus Jidaibacter acanthamoebae TaxID=86105 RepID=A0A0C1QEZ8_9RICK|nr:hypothetical protein NF27_JM00010 [Candidatus Jidaibacter acanthamoeba]KIE05152.1 hypothetical protein NF27_EU00020 [Candidatus Jidaibacter acanthamoeba]
MICSQPSGDKFLKNTIEKYTNQYPDGYTFDSPLYNRVKERAMEQRVVNM